MIPWSPSSTFSLRPYKEDQIANSVCGAHNFLTFLCLCLQHIKMALQYSPSSFDEAYSNKTSSNQDTNPSSTETLNQTLETFQTLGNQQFFGTAPYSNPQNQSLFSAQSQNLLNENCFDFDPFQSHVEESPRTSLASERYIAPGPPLTGAEESRIMRYSSHSSYRQPSPTLT